MPYLRWFRSAIFERRRLTISVASLMGVAGLLVGLAMFFEGDVVPSGDGSFGSVDGRWGAVSAPTAQEILDRAESEGIAAAATCDGSVLVGEQQRIVDARWIAPSASITDSMLTRRAAVTLREEGGIALSAVLASTLGVRPGDVVRVNGAETLVASVGSDVDATDRESVFVAGLASAPDDAGCYLLGPDSDWLDQANWSLSAPATTGVWWPRFNESVVAQYRVLLGFALLVFGIAVVLMLTTGLGLLTASLAPERKLMRLVGAPERRLDQTIVLGFLGLGGGASVIGVGCAFLLERLLGPAVADGFHVARLGGVGMPLRIVMAITLLFVATLAGTHASVRHWRRSGKQPSPSRWGLIGLLVLLGGVAITASSSRFSLWFGAGAMAMIVGALLAVPLPALVLFAFLERRGPVTQVAVSQVRLQRRYLLPLVFLVATLCGLMLLVEGGVSATLQSRRDPPTAHADQIVVTTEINSNRPTFPDRPTGALDEGLTDELTRTTAPFGAHAPLYAVEVRTEDLDGPMLLEYFYELNDLGDGFFAGEQVPVYVGTPELAAVLGIELESVASDEIVVYTQLIGNASFFNLRRSPPGPEANIKVMETPGLDTSIAPSVLITPDDADRLGTPVPVGDFVRLAPESDRELARSAIESFAHSSGVIVLAAPDLSGLERIVSIVRLSAAAIIAAVAALAGYLLARLAIADRQLLHLIGASQRTQWRIDLIATAVLAGCAMPPITVIGVVSANFFASVTSASAGLAGRFILLFAIIFLAGLVGTRAGGRSE